MMNDNSDNGGIGFVGALQIAFIVLKLCDVIDWPWLWVLAPIWTFPVLVVVIAIILWPFV